MQLNRLLCCCHPSAASQPSRAELRSKCAGRIFFSPSVASGPITVGAESIINSNHSFTNFDRKECASKFEALQIKYEKEVLEKK